MCVTRQVRVRLKTATPPFPACVICDASLTQAPTAVRLGSFELRVCPACACWVALPRPTAIELAQFHASEAYHQHPYLELRRAAMAASERRCRLAFDRFRQAAPALPVPGARLLDIGCDTGNLLDAARRLFAVSPFGVEVAARASRIAAQRGIEVWEGLLEAAPAEFATFDLITAIDLVEHVAAPQPFFAECARRLRPGGLMYLETPNVGSIIYRLGRALWLIRRGVPNRVFHRLFPPEHVEYYSHRGLEILAVRAGLRIVALGTRPLPGEDIAVSRPLRAALGAMQAMDRITRRHALTWAVLQRPLATT